MMIRQSNALFSATSGQSVARNGTCLTVRSGRHQLKPVITRGAETMNTIFKQHQAKSA
jgi:riboflavin synthase alpha subunit